MDSGRVRHLRQKQASAEDRLRPRCALNLLTDLVWVDVKTPSKTKSRKPHIAPSDTPPSSRTRLSSSNTSTVSPTSTLESTRIDVSASDCSPACSHKLKRRQRNTGLLWNTCTCTCIRTTHRRCAMRVNIGYRPHQGTFKCTNGSCWVSEYQADLNAAANRVNRLNPWGKSLPWISASDDSPQSGVSVRSIKTRYRVRNSRLRGGLPVTRVRLAHQQWERGRNRRPVMRTRLETSIQHLVEIPPAVEAPAFRLGEDITRLNLRLYLSTAWGHIIARHLLWLTSDDRYYCHHNHHHRYKQSNVIT